jgi:hypothetical protein
LKGGLGSLNRIFKKRKIQERKYREKTGNKRMPGALSMMRVLFMIN